jgi:probable HAF family extracellular repeat protein
MFGKLRFILALTAALAALPAASADWRIFDLGRPDGSVRLDLAAISDRGEVAGGAFMAGSPFPTRVAFVASTAGFTLFGAAFPVTVTRDINRAGVVVGGDGAAFSWDGTKSALPGLAGFSVANAINDRGVIVGNVVQGDSGGFRAFVHEDGETTLLGTLGGSGSHAYGINRRGDIVGTADTPFTASRIDFGHAYLLPEGGAMIDLGTLGGKGSVAYAVNNRGQVVGASLLAGDTAKHGFLHENGAMIDLGTLPGAITSDAIGINDRGEIVGVSLAINAGVFVERPILWRDGRMIDLAAAPELAEAGFTSWVIRAHQVGDSGSEGPGIAINQHGDIAGIGIKNGEERLFVMSPLGSRR